MYGRTYVCARGPTRHIYAVIPPHFKGAGIYSQKRQDSANHSLSKQNRAQVTLTRIRQNRNYGFAFILGHLG